MTLVLHDKYHGQAIQVGFSSTPIKLRTISPFPIQLFDRWQNFLLLGFIKTVLGKRIHFSLLKLSYRDLDEFQIITYTLKFLFVRQYVEKNCESNKDETVNLVLDSVWQ